MSSDSVAGSLVDSNYCCGYAPGAPECKECPDIRHCPKKDIIELMEMFVQSVEQIRSRRY